MSEKKFRSIRRKRKGFSGKRLQDIATDHLGTDDMTHVFDDGPRLGPSGSLAKLKWKRQKTTLKTSY